MKQTNLLKTFLLLCALVVGSTCAWADYEEVYTLDGTITGGTNTYADASEITQNGKDWLVTGNTTTNPWRIGGKSLTNVDREIVGQTAFTEAISIITFNHAGTTSDNLIVNSVKLTVASDEDFTDVIDEVTETPTIAKNTNGSFDFEPTTLSEWPTGSYYKFTINVSNSKSSNYGFCPTSIVFYTNVSKTATTTTIDASGITNTNVATGTAAGSLSVSVTAGGNPVAGATVTWTSSDESVATITDAGVVTLVAKGETTITASYAGDETHSASSDTYALTVTDSRVAPGLAYEVASQTVTVGEVLTAPTLTNPNSLEVTYSSGDESIATVDESGNVTGVAVGSTTITALFAGNASYSAGSASYTITVQKAKPVGALFYESVSGYTGTGDSNTVLTNSSEYLDSEDWNTFTKVYAGKVLSGDTDGHFKFGTGSAEGTAATKSIALTGNGKLTYKVQRYSSTENGNLTITVTGATATGDMNVTGTDKWVEKTVYLTEATGNVVITFATTSSGYRIRVDDILLTQVTSEPVAITSATGFATLYTAYPLDFSTLSSELKAYTAKVTGNTVTLTQVDNVPANTGIVLKGDVKTHNVPVIASSTTEKGDLTGSVTEDLVYDSEATKDYFYLGINAGKAQFKRLTSGSIGAGKAYLALDKSTTARELDVVFDETTALTLVNSEKRTVNSDIYNLAGQRVANPTKGLYIVNGRKVVVK